MIIKSICDQGFSFEETQHSLSKDQINSKYDLSQMKVTVTVCWTQKIDPDKEIESRVANVPLVHIYGMSHIHCSSFTLPKNHFYHAKEKLVNFKWKRNKMQKNIVIPSLFHFKIYHLKQKNSATCLLTTGRWRRRLIPCCWLSVSFPVSIPEKWIFNT